jgi:hypothetical protein
MQRRRRGVPSIPNFIIVNQFLDSNLLHFTLLTKYSHCSVQVLQRRILERLLMLIWKECGKNYDYYYYYYYFFIIIIVMALQTFAGPWPFFSVS